MLLAQIAFSIYFSVGYWLEVAILNISGNLWRYFIVALSKGHILIHDIKSCQEVLAICHDIYNYAECVSQVVPLNCKLRKKFNFVPVFRRQLRMDNTHS